MTSISSQTSKRRAGRGVRMVLTLSSLLVSLAGCGRGPQEQATEGKLPPPGGLDRSPIVLVPGISREVAGVLKGGRFTPFSRLALRTDADAIANLGDPRFPADSVPAMEAPGMLDRALRGTDVRGMQPLIDHLIQVKGYIRGNPDQPRDKNYPENPVSEREDRTAVASLFVVHYDWRRDLAENACVLADRIARIRAVTGAARVHLVAHSYGGVVSRYFLRYGGRDVIRDRDCPVPAKETAAAANTPGGQMIDRAVLLGAPFHGSVLALRALLEDFNLFGFISVGLREAVFTMPLAWELLPQAEQDGRVPLLTGVDGDGRVPLYAPRTWIDRRWLLDGTQDGSQIHFVEAMLARSLALQKHMAERNPAEEEVPRLVVGGDCRPTSVRAIATAKGVQFLGRDQSDHPLYSAATAPGDGVVTADSAISLPASPTLTVLTSCTGHSTYFQDPDLLIRVVQFLLG
ncbi:MAG TPA: hypothetical protein VN203_18110 [Candidatus Acidoferrum sp.]|nr:hypothetical protein [Candidatus Acidoferrum sp.]